MIKLVPLMRIEIIINLRDLAARAEFDSGGGSTCGGGGEGTNFYYYYYAYYY